MLIFALPPALLGLSIVISLVFTGSTVAGRYELNLLMYVAVVLTAGSGVNMLTARVRLDSTALGYRSIFGRWSLALGQISQTRWTSRLGIDMLQLTDLSGRQRSIPLGMMSRSQSRVFAYAVRGALRHIQPTGWHTLSLAQDGPMLCPRCRYPICADAGRNCPECGLSLPENAA